MHLSWSDIVDGSLRLRARQRLLALATGLVLACLTPASHAGPPPWPDGEFTYYADKITLREVLQDFAAGFNLALEASIPLSEPVNGRFNLRSATEFINRLGGTYGFVWFTHAGRLYVSPGRDIQVRAITAGAVSNPANNLRGLLLTLGVLEPKFGWGELPERGTVMVSGPPAYIDLVERTIRALPDGPSGMQVAVFRLKHASVQDRTVSYRDREITNPGVATIIRNLIMGTAFAQTTERTVPQPNMRATSDTAGESARASPAGSAGSAEAPGGEVGAAGRGASGGTGSAQNIAALPRFRPSIQAEPRTNSIIVQDTPDRIPVYERLVAQLDVPTQLVEIEALIIDVNTNRLSELGVVWGTAFDNQRGALGFGSVANSPISNNTVSIVGSTALGGASPTAAIVSGADYFVARLRMLEQQGDAAIQARPSIITSENLGAVIDLSETQYLQTTSERTALVTPITAGTTLRVTPRLVGAGDTQKVHLTLDIEDGQIQSAAAGTRPSVRRGVVSTEATIRPEESLLIGGYNSVQTVKGEDKVPLLGDIPLVGALFRTQTDQLQRRERLFLIRSTVAAGGSTLSARPLPDLQLESPRPVPQQPVRPGTSGSLRPSGPTIASSPRAPSRTEWTTAASFRAEPGTTIPGTNISLSRDVADRSP
jgi:type III secretion protein C